MAELPEGWKTVGYLTDDGATIDTEALLEPKSVTFQMQLDKASAEIYTGMSTLDMIAELQKKLSAPPIPGSLKPSSELAAAAKGCSLGYATPQRVTVADEMGYQVSAPDGSVLIVIMDFGARRFVLRRPDGEFVLVPDVQAWHWTDIYEPANDGPTWSGPFDKLSGSSLIPQLVRQIRVTVGVGVVSSLAEALGSQVWVSGSIPAAQPLPQRRSNRSLVNQLLALIPGAGADVKNPSVCTDVCDRGHSVRSMVIHLNDDHRWTYQQIADWLDTLDVDLTIHTKED